MTLEGVAQGELLSGEIAIEAAVSGVEDLGGVEFLVNGTAVDTVEEWPFAITIDTTAFAEGDAVISAVALGSDAAPRADVDVTFDNAHPVIALLPASQTEIFLDGGEFTVRLSVTDASPLSDVEVSVNGLTRSVASAPYEALFELSALGLSSDDLPVELAIEVKATDAAGQQSVATYDRQLSHRLAWSFSTLGEVWAPPVFGADGTAYFGSRDGKLYAVDSSGTELWRYDTGAEVVVSPALDDTSGETLIYVCSGSTVQVLNTAGEQAKTPYDSGSTVATRPAIGSSQLYVGTFDGKLKALSLTDNSLAWEFAAGDAVHSAPLVVDDNLIVFGSDDHWVYGVDASGQMQWQTETGGPVWAGVTRTATDQLLVGSHDGYLYELSRGGAKVWEFEARGQIWGEATEGPNGSIYVTSTFRRLYSLDAVGEQQWEVETDGFAYATPAVASSGQVFVAATSGEVLGLGSNGSERWTYAIDGEIIGALRLSPDQSLVVVGSTDRHMYALRTGLTGDEEEEPATEQTGGEGQPSLGTGDGGDDGGSADAYPATSGADLDAGGDAMGLEGVLSCALGAAGRPAPGRWLALLLGLTAALRPRRRRV
jgi:hypothetical protein